MNSKKATATTKVVLNEDVIMEIVVRLPLKSEIRCMVLNKSFFHLISERKKILVLSAFPDIEGSIIGCYSHTFKRNIPGSSKILPITITGRYDAEDPLNPLNMNPPLIMDSCNGVLLLRLEFHYEVLLCVFNPITGEAMTVNPLFKFSDNRFTLSLAVDLEARTTFQFKIVAAEKLFPSDKSVEETVWNFTVLVPFGGKSWRIISLVKLVCSGHSCCLTQAVYVNGCVYYNDYNHGMFVFDVEKQRVRSIDWPEGVDAFLYGSSDGSLQCVSILKGEFEIHSYDQVKNVWHLKHKITNIESSPTGLFCNGQRVLFANYFQVRDRREPDKLFHIYDISRKKWEKVPKDFFSRLNLTYFSFVPTHAKVSDKYLHDPTFAFAEVFLRGLQRLVLQETRDAVVVG